MKKLILFLVLSIATVVSAQKKMSTKTGNITFEATVPTFEEIRASNDAVSCVLHTENGKIVTVAIIKNFLFKLTLMQEHFNENYLESDKYPKSTFRGKIENFDAAALTEIGKEFTINGELELHGKTKDLSIIAKIRRTDTGIEIISIFNVNADDFDIIIPSIVKNKISNTVNVKMEFLVK